MPSPKITCIIPTYQRPDLLKRAINSVLNQTYADFQICIYDNASGDETANTVAAFKKKDTRIHYTLHEKNIGMMANYQLAISKVNTPFFCILSDDDD